MVFFEQENPEYAMPWSPMISKALEYTIDQEFKYFKGRSFSLPVAWLPESIQKNADLEYLLLLQNGIGMQR